MKRERQAEPDRVDGVWAAEAVPVGLAGGISALVGAVAIAVLLGWVFDLAALQSIIPGYVTMKVNTAVGLGLASLSLGCAVRGRRAPSSSPANIAARCAAAVAALIGIATLAEYATGTNLGIDQLFWSARAEAALTATPGRMAAVTAVALVLLGGALLLGRVRTPRGRYPAEWLAVASGGLGLAALIAYVYRLVPVVGPGQGLQIAIHTAICVVLLSTGILASEPTRGWMQVLTSRGAAGVVARRLLPVAFLVPFLLGASRYMETALFGGSILEKDGILAVIAMLAFGAVIWVSAHRLEEADERWHAAETRRLRAETEQLASRELAFAERAARMTAEHAVERIETHAAALLRTNTELALAKHQAERAQGMAETLTRAQQALLEAMPDVVLVVDRTGTYLNVPGNEDLLMMPAENLVGHNMTEFFPPDVAARNTAAIERVLATGVKTEIEYRVDFQGQGRTFAGIVSPLTADSVLWIARDITERKTAEERLLRSQKLDAVGKLAGGIAHDFNNMLTVITSYAELILRGVDGSDPVRTDVLEIKGAAERASQLTTQLLAFGRKQALEPRALDMNETVLGVERMLRTVLPAHIELSLELASEPGVVVADQGQLEQVLMNRVLNSRDAMPNGGSLLIETDHVDVASSDGWDSPYAAPGRYVVLSITDDGVGMPRSVRDRAFEPFFTTKQIGYGSGLGLATAHGVITQSGGHITLYSEPGIGTTVRILLPEVQADATSETPITAPIEQKTHSGTILLIEDEPLVRNVTQRVLQRAGYKVIPACNGAEGVALFNEHDAEIALVLTDMIMPELGGPDVAAAVRAVRPGVPLLFMSGYTEESVLKRGLASGVVHMLHKPFTPDMLIDKVHHVMTTGGADARA